MRQSRKSELCKQAILSIQAKKGIDIVLIDLSEIKDSISDIFIICTANNDKQVEAIVDSIQEVISLTCQTKPLSIDGYKEKNWVVIDYFDIIIHVFTPDVRIFYDLENLWGDGIIEKIENEDDKFINIESSKPLSE